MTANATILVVDDEASARDVIQGFLTIEPYNLLFAANATETFSILNEVAPDVILLDIMLSETDGFEICRQIKTDARWQHIPIILITALDGANNMEMGYEVGADDFLHKPINDYELRVRVRSMLRIKRQYDRLQNALRLREDLSNMVVHDIRTPLTAISGFSTLLKMNNTIQKEDVQLVDMIIHETEQLNSFLNDMLLVAKQEYTGKMMVALRPMSIQSLAKTINSTHHFTADARRVMLCVEFPDTNDEIVADSNLLQRIIDNLISNAIKFSPDGGTVTVQMETFTPPAADRLHLRLRVTDEGPGISEDAKIRIFEKFEVVSMKQGRVSQVGLGLPFCRLAAEAHNGRIWVEDNQPHGSIFTVEL